MDFRDMLTEIKDVVTNHSESNYVLSNIYLRGNLDNLADLPDNLRNTAFAEILGSNPDIDVRSALVERIDELVVDVSSIKFEDLRKMNLTVCLRPFPKWQTEPVKWIP